ncbi:MAG: GNAT family N-acetyltransferase [Burkholderiaceae bacterium]
MPQLTESLAAEIPGFWLAVSITQIDPLLGESPIGSDRSGNSEYIETAWVDIESDFEKYWNQRGKNLRQNMRKQRNKLLADGIDARMSILTKPADIGAAVQRYGVLESSGWKASQGTSIHPDNAQGKFYHELLEQAAGRGEAVIYEYLFADRTVAMSLCLRRNRTLVMLKTTYDESIKVFSPAFLLSQDLLQHLFKEGQIDRLEYFGRVMEWHTRWTSNKRSLFHFTLYRWPLVKTMAEKRRQQREARTLAVAAAG